MAYDLSQKRIIAHELARSGGNVAAAVARLRSEYESFRKVGDTTLRRLAREAGFAELVAEQGAGIAKAQADALIERERERARREAEGTLLDRLAHDERMLDELRRALEQAIKAAQDSGGLKFNDALRAFDALTRIMDRRKERALPAVGESANAEIFVGVVVETLQSELGPTRSPGVVTRIKEAYLARVAERARAGETPAVQTGEANA
jgi:hypothetical protein